MAILGLAALALAAAIPAGAADPDGAERQYRIARRLIAEGSLEAVAALDKVLELDPTGGLADDATVEKALLMGIPRWPEELGRLAVLPGRQALELVTYAARELSGADRALEARYLRALLLLEQLHFHNPSEARLDLITVATAPGGSDEALRARYAVGWLAEQQGQSERALAAYQRLVVDAPGSQAALRAEIGLGRLLLRQGSFGPAAERLQHASSAGAPKLCAAEALKELAVRSLLGIIPGSRGNTRPSSFQTVVRSPAGMAAMPQGGILLGDQKAAEVIHFDARGVAVDRWSLKDLRDIAASDTGRAFAAAGDDIFRLEPGGEAVRIASQGTLQPVSSLEVDGLGRLWLIDKKGESVARIEPGATSPVQVGARERGFRLPSTAWDGLRLIAVDSREKLLVAVGVDGSMRQLSAGGFQKPLAVTASRAGQAAVLDGREKAVLFYDSAGKAVGRMTWSAAGVGKPVALDYSADGALLLFDGSTGRVVRVP
jgi:tetratricopeptide (TPR) repeat protein